MKNLLKGYKKDQHCHRNTISDTNTYCMWGHKMTWEWDRDDWSLI